MNKLSDHMSKTLSKLDSETLEKVICDYPGLIKSVTLQLSFEFYYNLIVNNPRVFEYLNKNIPRYNELKEVYEFSRL